MLQPAMLQVTAWSCCSQLSHMARRPSAQVGGSVQRTRLTSALMCLSLLEPTTTSMAKVQWLPETSLSSVARCSTALMDPTWLRPMQPTGQQDGPSIGPSVMSCWIRNAQPLSSRRWMSFSELPSRRRGKPMPVAASSASSMTCRTASRVI